jgi:hypothetical protein
MRFGYVWGKVRLDGIHHVFQDILELGGVLLDLVEGTGVRRL